MKAGSRARALIAITSRSFNGEVSVVSRSSPRLGPSKSPRPGTRAGSPILEQLEQMRSIAVEVSAGDSPPSISRIRRMWFHRLRRHHRQRRELPIDPTTSTCAEAPSTSLWRIRWNIFVLVWTQLLSIVVPFEIAFSVDTTVINAGRQLFGRRLLRRRTSVWSSTRRFALGHGPKSILDRDGDRAQRHVRSGSGSNRESADSRIGPKNEVRWIAGRPRSSPLQLLRAGSVVCRSPAKKARRPSIRWVS